MQSSMASATGARNSHSHMHEHPVATQQTRVEGLEKGYLKFSKETFCLRSACSGCQGAYEEGSNTTTQVLSNTVLLHSSQNILATTRHDLQCLKAHPETKQWKYLVSDKVWQNQMPSCSASSMPRQYSEAEIRWPRDFKDDLSRK